MINIFIPTYNGEPFLSETLDSILSQSYRSWELYCVDDSSSDSTFSLLQSYAAKDSRIKVFQKPNGGDAPHSWQYILPHLTGEFTLYMSQDDLLKPDTLEHLVSRQQETDADAVIPSLTWYYGDGQPSKTDQGVHGDLSPLLSGKEAFELMMDYSIPGFALWRTNIIKSNPVPLTAFNSDEYSQRDWCSHCRHVAFSDGEYIYRQNNPNAITHRFNDRRLEASITDAMVIQRAVELGISETTIVHYANERYKDLWFHAMWLLQYRKELPYPRRQYLRELLSRAFQTLHNYVTLNQRKYRWSAHNLFLFWSVIRLKWLRAKSIENIHTYSHLFLNLFYLLRLKAHKIIHHINRPIIHYYAVCWNEERMLPFMFQHYESFVNHFTIYDNHSTDNSAKLILSRDDTTLIEFDSDGFCDNIHNDIKNSCWKKSRGHADYVIVCDIDEFLYHPNIKKEISKLKRQHISVVQPIGFNMFNENPPEYQTDNPLPRQTSTGLRAPMFDKCILFDPHAIVEINYKPGAHECHPWGRIKTSTNTGIKLLHYKNLGIEQVLQRNRLYVQRLSKDNIENRYGIEYLRNEETIVNEFYRNLQLSHTVIE